MKYLPNFLSLSRIILIVPIAISINKELYILSLFLVSIAALSDWLDGEVSRKYNCTSLVGAILDPIADKFFVMGLLTCFFLYEIYPYFLFYYTLVCLRNISQLLAIPILQWICKKEFFVKPKLFAKWGTVLNMLVPVGIVFSFLISYFPQGLEIFDILLWGLVLTSSFFECVILVTYWPRLVAIIIGKHNTFE